MVENDLSAYQRGAREYSLFQLFENKDLRAFIPLFQSLYAGESSLFHDSLCGMECRGRVSSCCPAVVLAWDVGARRQVVLLPHLPHSNTEAHPHVASRCCKGLRTCIPVPCRSLPLTGLVASSKSAVANTIPRVAAPTAVSAVPQYYLLQRRTAGSTRRSRRIS